jgi:hypothetical protein
MAKQWYIFKGGVQYGPLAPEDLKREATSGELRPDDHVRPEDRQNWFKASTVKGLFTPNASGSLQALLPSPSKQPVETGHVVASDSVEKVKAATNYPAITKQETASSQKKNESIRPVSPNNKSRDRIIFISCIVLVLSILVVIPTANQYQIDHPKDSYAVALGTALVGWIICGLLIAAVVLGGLVGFLTPQEQLKWGVKNSMLVCPHCQTTGNVRTKPIVQKSGISGAKATGAVLTGGISILATGLSQKENKTQAHCDKCGSTWVF